MAAASSFAIETTEADDDADVDADVGDDEEIDVARDGVEDVDIDATDTSGVAGGRGKYPC